jgi:hypothetical protein
MDFIVNTQDKRSFATNIDKAISEAGACLGQDICRIVVNEVDPNYDKLKPGYRVGVSPKFFTVEKLTIRHVGMMEAEGENVVILNNDINMLFAPGALLEGEVTNPLSLADEIIKQGTKKYFTSIQQGCYAAKQMNMAVKARMEQVSKDHAHYAQTIAKVIQANDDYAKHN